MFAKMFRTPDGLRPPRLALDVRREIRRIPLRWWYRKYRDHTMIPAERYTRNLELARRVRGTRGCVIECGVWRGGMSAGIAEVMGPEREYFLFDSFEGLPPATALDGGYAARWQNPENRRRNFNNCTASIEEAETAMRMTGVPRYHLVKGWFEDTLSKFKPPEPIALLRVDGDW
jgi:O-methyltransferase